MFKKFLFMFILAISLFSIYTSVVATPCPAGTVCLENPLQFTAEQQALIEAKQPILLVIIGSIVKYAMAFMGSLAFAVFVAAGLYWITSQGNSEKVKKGTDAMLWAIIGLFIIFSSYAILTLVLNAITGDKEAAIKINEASVAGSETTTKTEAVQGVCWYKEGKEPTKDDPSKCGAMTEEECFKNELVMFYPKGTNCVDLQTKGSCLFPKTEECVNNERAYCEGLALQNKLDTSKKEEFVWRPGVSCETK